MGLLGGIDANARVRLAGLVTGVEALRLRFLNWKWKDVEYGVMYGLSALTKQVDSQEIISSRYRLFL